MFTSKNFKNLGSEKEKDIQQKLAKFAPTLVILDDALKPTLVEKLSRIKVYNALALPILLDGNEIWTLREKDKKTKEQPGTPFLTIKGMKKLWRS
jgi:hypothetical protein